MNGIVSAYSAIFPSGRRPTRDDLEALTPGDLKRAYRRRALDCHPDRAQSVEAPPEQLSDQFSQLNHAYETLQQYLRHRATPSVSRRARHRNEQFWTGEVPNRPLTFGEFLYYSKRISWQTLAGALERQRSSRPAIGEMARSWGLMSQDRINQIIHLKREGELFGQAAVRLGYLSLEHCRALLGIQRKQQKPLGAYLVAVGSISSEELPYQLEGQRIHNRAAWAAA